MAYVSRSTAQHAPGAGWRDRLHSAAAVLMWYQLIAAASVPLTPSWVCCGAVAGLEAEIGKLLAAAQAVQQQYGIGGSGPAAGESLQQQADGDAPPPPPAPPVDVPMQEAGA